MTFYELLFIVSKNLEKIEEECWFLLKIHDFWNACSRHFMGPKLVWGKKLSIFLDFKDFPDRHLSLFCIFWILKICRLVPWFFGFFFCENDLKAASFLIVLMKKWKFYQFPTLKSLFAPQIDHFFSKSSHEIDIRTQSKVAFLANYVKILSFFGHFLWL